MVVARLVDVARVVLTLVVGGRELLAERDVLQRTVVAGRQLLGTATALLLRRRALLKQAGKQVVEDDERKPGDE